MITLETEQDIEVLRTCAILYRNECLRAWAKSAGSKNEQITHAQMSLEAKLRDQIVKLKKRLFGFGREELRSKKARPVGHRQQELLLHNERSHAEAPTGGESASGEADETSQNDRLQAAVLCHVDHDFRLEDFERENAVREIRVAGNKSGAGAVWKKIEGLEQQTVEITIVERIYKKVVHRQARYRLRTEYNDTGKEVIITAPGPVKLNPGCQYSVDFALAVTCDKYESHLPLERQRRRMESAGLEMNVKTLYGLVRQVADHCEESVIPKIRRDILSDFVAAHLDESPWPILGTRTRGQMWVLSNRIGSYYRFEPTRSGRVAEEMLDEYSGSVLTDGFAGYNRIKRMPKIRCAACWSHARREFTDREDDYPTEASQFVAMCDELSAIEHRAKSFEQLRLLRMTESRSVIARMREWLWQTKTRFLKGEGIVSAVDYCLKLWPELTLFLRDLSVPLDNNSAERAERHAVMGRKNFGGSRTIDGADVAAILYTVIESCKKVGLHPREYLKYVITERWHKRDPRSPLEVSIERFGRNPKVIYPEKDDWLVQAA